MISLARGKKWALLLTAAMAVVTVVPAVSYAQLGGLANFAKGKAVEILTDKVMAELEKKFAETVAKEPISEAAKANTVKKLSELARPIVKRFIDGAASGKLPNPMELVQTVLKDILPRVPEIIAAARAEEGGGTPPPPQQGYAIGQPQTPQYSTVQYAATPPPPPTLPKITVYTFGAEDPALNKAMTTRLIAALSGNGHYQPADNYKEFFEHASLIQGDAASLSSEQIRQLGKLTGMDYICVAEISTIFDEKQVSAHIIDVENGGIKATGTGDTPLKTMADLTTAADQIVKMMFKNMPPPTPPAPIAAAPVYAPAPQQPVYAQPQPMYTPAPQQYGYQQNYQANMYTNQDLRRAVAPIDENAPYNFSGGERFGTFALNWLIPGLGSASIMQDWPAFGTQLGLYGAGWALMSAGLAMRGDDGVPLAILGGASFTANFIYNIARSATYNKPGSIDRPKVKRTDFYFSPKYQMPWGTPVSWGGTNVEFGWIWGDGAFFGIDLDFGIGAYDGANYYDDYSDAWMIGGGFSLGKAYEFGNDFQIAYGGSVGFWYSGYETRYYSTDSYGYFNNSYYIGRDNYNFLAPFVKFRWNVFELSYRGLLGIYDNYNDFYNYKGYSDYDYYDGNNGGFSWNNHQVLLGFYFATSKRERH